LADQLLVVCCVIMVTTVTVFPARYMLRHKPCSSMVCVCVSARALSVRYEFKQKKQLSIPDVTQHRKIRWQYSFNL
jgi:hypothetical protein